MALTNESRIKAFWSRVKIGGENECWHWQGSLQSKGYGEVWWNGKPELAHRVAYALANGLEQLPPPGRQVMHACDNRVCCNPAHLGLGTSLENVTDAVTKGRHPHGETHGRARLSSQNVREILILGEHGLHPKQLAQFYQVNRATVMDILRGRTWVHLQQERAGAIGQ